MLLAEQLVGEARKRRPQRMPPRERVVMNASAAAYLAVAVAIAVFLPSERDADPLLMAGLVVGYVLVSQVRFEFGGYYVVPEQLMLVPMLVLAPLPAVPLLAGGASVLAMGSDIVRGSAHRDRWLTPVGDSWFVIGPVLVLAALAPGAPSLALTDVYALALAAQMLFDFSWTMVRNALLDGLPVRDAAHHFAGTARVELILSPIAFVTALVAYDDPLALLAIGPLVWLLELFSQGPSRTL